MGRENWLFGQVNPLASGFTYSPSPTNWRPVGQHLIIRGWIVREADTWRIDIYGYPWKIFAEIAPLMCLQWCCWGMYFDLHCSLPVIFMCWMSTKDLTKSTTWSKNDQYRFRNDCPSVDSDHYLSSSVLKLDHFELRIQNYMDFFLFVFFNALGRMRFAGSSSEGLLLGGKGDRLQKVILVQILILTVPTVLFPPTLFSLRPSFFFPTNHAFAPIFLHFLDRHSSPNCPSSPDIFFLIFR